MTTPRWYALLAPLIGTVGAARIGADPYIIAVTTSLFRQGIEAAPLGPAEFDALIRAEIPRIRKIVRHAGISLDQDASCTTTGRRQARAKRRGK